MSKTETSRTLCSAGFSATGDNTSTATRHNDHDHRVTVVVGGGVEPFTIKGLKAGPTFSFSDHVSFAEVIDAVEEELARANGFFRDSPVVLNFGRRILHKDEWRALKDILHREGLLLRYAVATESASRDLLYKEGLPVRETVVSPADEAKAAQDTTITGSNALYLRHGLRSGQKKVFEGNLLLTGDVNRGAEILAGGDVIVIGTLRGMVHAGYPDNSDAVVVALNLMPVQLRIGPHMGRAEEEQNHRRVYYPEIARVQDERIVIEPYQRKV